MQREEYGQEALYVVEVYYDDNDNSIIGWTQQEEVWGESIDGVSQCLSDMAEALEKPILIEADLLRQMES